MKTWNFRALRAALLGLLLAPWLALAAACSAQAPLLIVEKLPASTPDTARIFLAGSINQWNPANPQYQLMKQEDGTYLISLHGVGGDFEYKFTRGDWTTAEADSLGADIANRFFRYSNASPHRVEIRGWADQGADSANSQSTAAPNVHVLEEELIMPHLNRKRRLRIYLPPDYETDTDRRYPVLYMHDGQNLFDVITSFSGEWGVDDTLNELFEEEVHPGVIVVGIDNGGIHRIQEMTPWVNPEEGGGDGDKYAHFIVEVVKPFIDNNYRTLPGREHTGIMGSSLGGLMSYYIGMKYQEQFSRIGIFSPSFWFSDSCYTMAEEMGKREEMRMYFLAGGQESPTLVRNVTRMYETLLEAGFEEHELYFKVVDHGQHSEWFWREEFPEAFLWLDFEP